MFDLKICSCADAVNHARGSLPDREEIDSAAELFKMCADPTRVGILCALCSHRLCVCELAEVLGMTSSAISHQLRLMKQMGLISCHREGKSMYYSIADRHIEEMFSLALGYAKEAKH